MYILYTYMYTHTYIVDRFDLTGSIRDSSDLTSLAFGLETHSTTPMSFYMGSGE